MKILRNNVTHRKKAKKTYAKLWKLLPKKELKKIIRSFFSNKTKEYQMK